MSVFLVLFIYCVRYVVCVVFMYVFLPNLISFVIYFVRSLCMFRYLFIYLLCSSVSYVCLCLCISCFLSAVSYLFSPCLFSLLYCVSYFVRSLCVRSLFLSSYMYYCLFRSFVLYFFLSDLSSLCIDLVRS